MNETGQKYAKGRLTIYSYGGILYTKKKINLKIYPTLRNKATKIKQKSQKQPILRFTYLNRPDSSQIEIF